MKQKKFKPKNQLRRFDFIFTIIGILAIVISIVLPALTYSQLPDQIPTHYNANGLPDAYGNKINIWRLPFIGLVLFIGCFLLDRLLGQQADYPKDLLLGMGNFLALTFAYLIISKIQIATTARSSLGSYFLPVFLLLITGLIIYSILKSNKPTK
ncbi:MAG: DUF1648 domain-containing protein [Bacteroidota bacterium]